MLIKFGAKGETVKRIQRALNNLGYDVKIDGDFRNETYQAVRKFQADKGLDVDGKVGEVTLTALGLDPDTLEELSPELGDNTTDITMDEIVITEGENWADPELPPALRRDIDTYVKLVAQRENYLLTVLLEALNNFETTMSFASAAEAKRDIFGSLVSTAFEVGVDILWDQVIGKLPPAKAAKTIFNAGKKFFNVTVGEIERAGKANQSMQVGLWIKDQRSVITNQLAVATSQKKQDLLRIDTGSDFLERDEPSRQEFYKELTQAIMVLSEPIDNSIDEMEVKLYEQWINAHYDTDVSGHINFHFEYDDGDFEFVSCNVKTLFGEKIDTALNHLLDKGTLRNIHLPIDFKVEKRIHLKTDAWAGGMSWYNAWLDHESNIYHEQGPAEAKEGYHRPEWRTMAKRFG